MLSSYIKYLVTLDSLFYRTHVNLHFDPIWVLIPVGYTQPMTRMYQNLYPCVRVRVLTGTGTGCPEKPQGSPCHSLRMRKVCGVVSPPIRIGQCLVIGCSTVAVERDMFG